MMRTKRGGLVVLGDSFLDVDVRGTVERLAGDAPVPVVEQPERMTRPGGAALAASLAARTGESVDLITAVGSDRLGAILRTALTEAGVRLLELPVDETAITPAKIRVLEDDRPLLRIDNPGRVAPSETLSREASDALVTASCVLVSDYGKGVTAIKTIRSALTAASNTAPVVWDPHPKGSDPTPTVTLMSPNRREAEILAPGITAAGLDGINQRAALIAERFGAKSVVVTLGSSGALLFSDEGVPLAIPARTVRGGDACGAGDAFAAHSALSLGSGALTSEAAIAGVEAATAFVESGGVRTFTSTPAPAEDERTSRTAYALAKDIRARGGTVVATSGCFDILHAGHISSLVAARKLGDCLIVCLNSDASTRRLKGPGRPVNDEVDRARVLAALSCVDAVVSFDDDTPSKLLERLRPHIFAKGGDYLASQLPEAAVISAWGGQAVTLPYQAGRSTTQIIKEVSGRDIA